MDRLKDKPATLTTRTVEVAENVGDLAGFVAAVPFPAGPVWIDGKGGTDWVVLDARIDPHLAAGMLAIPRRARRHLVRIDQTGVDFDALLVGHELPAGSVAPYDGKGPAVLHGQKGPPALASPKELTEIIGAPPPDRTALRTVAAADKAIKTIGRVAGQTGAGAQRLLSGAADLFSGGLDPVVFGAVAADGPPQPGELVALFYLVHWR